ncbi:MAG: cytochrome b N-terminal domain-containing protein [Desulfitobacteriaceae bacterium]|nr:cytochrome b N-terminal domain-containing protein [Desulfitobacteriaceae bacterium]MDI6913548.1 cytochrome b N-terminal domain-containing protein [Desulfitobacteriaceae bacterium]
MSLLKRFTRSRVFQSVFRGDPDLLTNPAAVMRGSLLLHLHPAKVKKSSLRFTHTFGLGGTALSCFIILVVTGGLLMFYYVPSVNQAYDSMLFIGNKVFFGWFVRNLHRWSAHAMIIFVFVHMIRVFVTGSYKPPREFNWSIGIALLLLTLFFSYTGYLLPWDQLSYWGINVGVNLLNYVPLVGQKLRLFLLGDNTISQNTLIRFYVFHCFVLPVFTVILLSFHFWRVRKDGISSP